MRHGQDPADRLEGVLERLTFRKILGAGLALVVGLGLLIVAPKLMENVDANEIVLIQSPRGTMSWHTTPGWVWQGLGKVTSYQKAGQLTFYQAEGREGRIKIGFNDGGTALITGSMNYEMPTDPQSLTEIHSFYPDQRSLEDRLIGPALNKSVYFTGPTMSSAESYASRRNLLIQYVEDQVQNGVYVMQGRDEMVPDDSVPPDAEGNRPMKKVTVMEIQTDGGVAKRAEEGQLARFHIRAFNFAVSDMDYSDVVDQQIAQQQSITMAVQTSIAQAKQAQQEAVTARSQGDANVARTRAEAEVEKTKAVVQAEKNREVARLAAEQAGFYKTEQLLRADADSEYKRRILAADGALQQKLDAYERIATKQAEAIANMKVPIVPATVLGGTGASSANGAQMLLDMLTARTARDLGLDITPGRPQ